MLYDVCIIDHTIDVHDQSTALVEIKREIENLQEQVSAMSIQVLNKKKEKKEEYEDIIKGAQSHYNDHKIVESTDIGDAALEALKQSVSSCDGISFLQSMELLLMERRDCNR